jgi:hypothetical protein
MKTKKKNALYSYLFSTFSLLCFKNSQIIDAPSVEIINYFRLPTSLMAMKTQVFLVNVYNDFGILQIFKLFLFI